MCASGWIAGKRWKVAAGLLAAISILFVATPLGYPGQEKNAAPPSDQAEVTSHDTEPTFELKTERNLVVVRVVVRDSKGNVRADLRKEDFRLFDNGKPQTITHFAVESPEAIKVKAAESNLPGGSASADPDSPATARTTARRFLALFFDDIHIELGDLMQVQQAAIKYISHALRPEDRVGVFTASGIDQVDFTDDVEKIRQTILRIRQRPITASSKNSCPQIFDYQAFLIIEQHDAYATDAAVEEYYHCNCEQLESQPQAAAQCRAQGASLVESEAYRAQEVFETNTEGVLRTLGEVVRHLASFPGQRTLVLASPGFMARNFEVEVGGIVDRALRANVVISSLDVKGLYAPVPGGDDISQDPVVTPRRPDLMGHKEQYRLDRMVVADEPLSNMASDTGGIFFHNSNDLEAGFERAGALSAVYYTLAYSPDNLKRDGKFHTLKVTLAEPQKLNLQARRGYFAPSANVKPEEKAKSDIEDAIYSQEEMNELPIDIHTQFFRVDQSNAKLSVLTHVDLRQVHFRKQEGRNMDNLTLVTVLFDRDGKYVTGQEKTLIMKLKDTSLDRLARSGITMKTSFDVKLGDYVIRQVVRDTEGEQLSGVSRPIEIR